LSQDIQASLSATLPAPASKEHAGQRLGAFLCWAVVFADIGTSVYYVPGILFHQVHLLAGLFVLMTMVVFLLLVLKYAEVSVRFPEGGGVVTVSARALNPWAGAVGGMFILVDYFLTSAISSLSGLQYFSAIFPQIAPYVLLITLVVVALLGVLNWWGIKESASVSAVIAMAALIGDVVIILVVFLAYTPSEILLVLGKMFSGERLTGVTILTGFAGAFLAFSGLESISQLSPVMKVPRSKTVTRALALVAITVGVTSPLLTIFSTVLLTTPLNATHGIPAPFNTVAPNPDQFISELARAYGGRILQVATAITASALLIFASNTAIIGAYHVFLALSRMRFFPEIVERTNKLRGTPHVSILLATGIPMLVLVAAGGRIVILGDLYAFGLLGAFTLTCLSLDVIRWRERHSNVVIGAHEDPELHERPVAAVTEPGAYPWARLRAQARSRLSADQEERLRRFGRSFAERRDGFARRTEPTRLALGGVWPDVRYYLGFLTTLLVGVAWVTNLFSKPHATLFGGGVTILGVGIAVAHYRYQQRAGAVPVFPLALLRPMPGSILVALPSIGAHNREVVRAAVESANGRPLVFVYLAERGLETPRAFQFGDPYLYDKTAQRLFSRAASLSRREGVPASFVYRVGGPDRLIDVWRAIRPDEIMAEASTSKSLSKIVSPEYVRYQDVDGIRVAHYVRHQLPQDEEAAQAAEISRRLRMPSRPRAPRPSRPLGPPATPGEANPPGRGNEPGRGADSPEPTNTGGTPGQGTDLDEWVWTGTDLVRRDQLSHDQEDDDAKH
jgi:amino acid transporter